MKENPMDETEAIMLVAQHVIADAVDRFGDEAWEVYPEVGEHDWERVMAKVHELVEPTRPNALRYEAAYAFLEARAETSAERFAE